MLPLFDEGEYRAFEVAAGWLVGGGLALPEFPESLEVERFISGLKLGPLKALGFFYCDADLSSKVGVEVMD